MNDTAPARTKTTYVILREKQVSGQDTVLVYEPVASGIEASSSDAALRKWTDEAKAQTPNGTYVAIPTRSFRPTKVTFVQQTIVKVG